MITIKRQVSDLVVLLETDLPHPDGGTTSYALRITCTSMQDAELLSRYLNTRLQDRIASIREESYGEGYTDGGKHRRKRRYYDGSIHALGLDRSRAK